MNFDLNEAIELLITNPAQSELAFPYERETCLYQLRTWVFCPDPEIVEMAAAISGAKYLRLLERKRTTRLLGFVKEHTSDDLKRYLNDVNYSKIYDSTVGEYGGWCKLVEDQQRINLKKEVAARDEVAETVCRMIDYRFRYLDHGGLDRQQANISHSEFYRWKREPKISWKTIRDRWSKSRTSAVYLYVTKRFHLDVSPRYNQMGYFLVAFPKMLQISLTFVVSLEHARTLARFLEAMRMRAKMRFGFHRMLSASGQRQSPFYKLS
jgi:hypothetical protein